MAKGLQYYQGLHYTRRCQLIVDDDARYFLAWIDEFPGCKVEGQTKAEAFKNLGELFEDYINAKLEWKDDIPEPVRPEKPTAYQTESRQHRPKVISLRFIEPATPPDSSLDQPKQIPEELITAGI